MRDQPPRRSSKILYTLVTVLVVGALPLGVSAGWMEYITNGHTPDAWPLYLFFAALLGWPLTIAQCIVFYRCLSYILNCDRLNMR